jgi:hypothetical protein
MTRPLLIVTNDPDHAQTEDYRRVFAALNRIPLRVTSAVFCCMEEEQSLLANHCRAGETHTLADPAFRELMIEQAELGHEIAFHGYSQISNRRDRFLEGLDIFRDIFGHDPFTYIEHGGTPERHPPGMCKNETLAMEGMDSDSPYFLMDILQERIGLVWAFEAIDDEASTWPPVDQLFYRLDDVLMFRRQRMFRLDAVEPPEEGGCFIGYTHFGYEGYAPAPENRLEKWTMPWLPFAIRGLEEWIERLAPENLTLRQLVESRLDPGGGHP